MLGTLTKEEIENIIMSQSLCRVACSDAKKPYVVPVSYAYDGKYIYFQTKEGKKIDILRKNPQVCIEIDLMMSMNHWQCVLINGKFEELKADEAVKAREILFNKILTLLTSSTIPDIDNSKKENIDDSNRIKPIMCRVLITEKSGRFEK